jgi:hypothetical protein
MSHKERSTYQQYAFCHHVVLEQFGGELCTFDDYQLLYHLLLHQ